MNIASNLERAAQFFPERLAISESDLFLTYNEFNERTSRGQGDNLVGGDRGLAGRTHRIRDIEYMDDKNYLYIIDRVKGLIITELPKSLAGEILKRELKRGIIENSQ
jgi:acyl-CoA synthetase (AMP-forming)/AMP-acid ligase II